MNSSEESLFLHCCAHFTFDPGVAAKAIAIAEEDCEEEGLDMAEIGEIDVPNILGIHPAFAPVVVACEGVLGLPAQDAELVYCEWTWTHVDTGFTKDLFVCLVLATGPQPYCIQALQGPTARGDDILDTKRIVSVGDVFVLDPCVPHMAAPVTPCDGAMLVLAQWRLPAATHAQRQAFRERFAPHAWDRHQTSLLDF